MERFEVEISDQAFRQFGECVYFIQKENEQAAEQLYHRLMDGISSLRSMPGRYPFFYAAYIPPNKYHKLYIEKYYLILYQIRDQWVYVDYVLDCRRDYRWLLHS